jgi:hypothetical protein
MLNFIPMNSKLPAGVNGPGIAFLSEQLFPPFSTQQPFKWNSFPHYSITGFDVGTCRFRLRGVELYSVPWARCLKMVDGTIWLSVSFGILTERWWEMLARGLLLRC